MKIIKLVLPIIIFAIVALFMGLFFKSETWEKHQFLSKINKALECEDYTTARKDIEAALDYFQDSNVSDLYLAKGDMYYQRGLRQNAIYWYRQAANDDKYKEKAVIGMAKAQILPGLNVEPISPNYWEKTYMDLLSLELEDVYLMDSKFMDTDLVNRYNYACRILKIAYEDTGNGAYQKALNQIESEKEENISCVSRISLIEGGIESQTNAFNFEYNQLSNCMRIFKGYGEENLAEATYDEYGQITGQKVFSIDAENNSYEYDSWGNIIRKTVVLGEEETIYDYIYNDNGQLVSETCGTDEYMEYCYNEEGSLTETYQIVDGEKILIEKNIYDTNENRVEKQSYSFRGIIVRQIIYDEQGRIRKYNAQDFNVVGCYDYDDTGIEKETIYDAYMNMKSYVTLEKDEVGNVVKKTFYDENNDFSGCVCIEYDENGLETVNRIYNSENVLAGVDSFQYDERGRVCAILTYGDDKITSYENGDYGDTTEVSKITYNE